MNQITNTNSKARVIPKARDIITNALIEYCNSIVPKDRKELFYPAIKALGLNKDELSDNSTDSTNTKYKALTGTIINELIQQGSIIIAESKPAGITVSTPKIESIKDKKAIVKDYIYSKYLTDDEKADKTSESKANIVKSILGYKEYKELWGEWLIEDIKSRVEEQFKKIAKISDVEEFPVTPIGNCLRNNREKYCKYKKKQINEDEYNKSLNASIVEAINLSGGVSFSKLSLDLVKALYNDNEVYDDKVTDGSKDHGIDAELFVKDKIGFVDKIVIQSKTKQNDSANIGEKITREFIGSMATAKASRGILIANAEIHKDARDIAKNVNNIIFVDKNLLIDLMKRYKIGIEVDSNGIAMLNTKTFLIE